MEQNEAEKNLPTSDFTANTGKPSDSFLNSSYAQSNVGSEYFNPDLREKLFYIWYNHGRPGFAKTKDLLQLSFPNEELPSDWSLKEWVTDFNARAYELDKRVHEQIESMVIAEKVEMMKRHAKVGTEMQTMALDFLRTHSTDLAPSSAIRMLVEGIRIERESRGIPEALEKMGKLSDEDLLNEIKNLLTSSSVTLEDINANS